jgi:hypothetical protein
MKKVFIFLLALSVVAGCERYPQPTLTNSENVPANITKTETKTITTNNVTGYLTDAQFAVLEPFITAAKYTAYVCSLIPYNTVLKISVLKLLGKIPWVGEKLELPAYGLELISQAKKLRHPIQKLHIIKEKKVIKEISGDGGL